SEGAANVELLATGNAADEHEISEVGAGDNEYEGGDELQHGEALSVIVAQTVDAVARRGELGSLFGDLGLGVVRCGAAVGADPAHERDPECILGCRHSLWIGNTDEEIEPVRLWQTVEIALGLEDGFLWEREPDACGIGSVALAEEALGGDADDGDR